MSTAVVNWFMGFMMIVHGLRATVTNLNQRGAFWNILVLLFWIIIGFGIWAVNLDASGTLLKHLIRYHDREYYLFGIFYQFTYEQMVYVFITTFILNLIMVYEYYSFFWHMDSIFFEEDRVY